jgi:hypothetical protein
LQNIFIGQSEKVRKRPPRQRFGDHDTSTMYGITAYKPTGSAFPVPPNLVAYLAKDLPNLQKSFRNFLTEDFKLNVYRG